MLATLTLTGWLFMLVSCGAVIALTVWCFKRVLFPAHDEPDLPPGLGP
jgi:hypothetical protein